MSNDNPHHNAEEVEVWITVQKWRKVAHKYITAALVGAACWGGSKILAHELAITRNEVLHVAQAAQHSAFVKQVEQREIETLKLLDEMRQDIKLLLQRIPANTAADFKKLSNNLSALMECQ